MSWKMASAVFIFLRKKFDMIGEQWEEILLKF